MPGVRLRSYRRLPVCGTRGICGVVADLPVDPGAGFVKSSDMAERTSHTLELPADKVALLKEGLERRGFNFLEVPHARFGAEHRGDRVNVTLYNSGKLVVQGKGTTDFITFFLEPEILGEARLGYETVLDPTMLEPRIGVDESGKGDYFGPLVVAGVYVTEAAVRHFMEIGVRDSKRISSDKRIAEIAREIRSTKGALASVVPIGPEAYNRLQAKMGSVNDILGWGHARVIENLLERVDCNRAVSDQFGNKRIVLNALMERGRKIDLVQRHKAESDLAVAAASILARDEFVMRLRRQAREFGVDMPKGASAAVDAAAREFVARHGRGALNKVAKVHFRTTQKIQQETSS